MSTREDIEQKLANTGNLSSADVAGFDEQQPEQSVEKSLREPATVEREKTKDKLITAAGDTERLAPPAGTNIEIAPADKDAFTAALIGNTRMTLSSKRLGGKCTITVRSRTLRETDAIIKQLQRESREGKFHAQLDQSMRLRALILAFQVAELNGTEYAIPEEPLIEIVSDSGTTKPAWIGRADDWYGQSDAMNTIVWGCIQEFEDKYWMMTENAANADFWQPVASI